MAEKYNIPVVTLVDTPGAYPGLEAEERGQGEAIARNILEMTRLKVPIITVIIGVLSVNVCGDGRPCQLPQQSHAPVTPRRHDVPRCSRSHHTLAVARAPPVFFNAMIHQQQCCASVAHRAPTPRLAQLRPRSLCARSRPRRLAQTDNFFSGPTVSTVSEGLLFVP